LGEELTKGQKQYLNSLSIICRNIREHGSMTTEAIAEVLDLCEEQVEMTIEFIAQVGDIERTPEGLKLK